MIRSVHWAQVMLHRSACSQSIAELMVALRKLGIESLWQNERVIFPHLRHLQRIHHLRHRCPRWSSQQGKADWCPRSWLSCPIRLRHLLLLPAHVASLLVHCSLTKFWQTATDLIQRIAKYTFWASVPHWRAKCLVIPENLDCHWNAVLLWWLFVTLPDCICNIIKSKLIRSSRSILFVSLFDWHLSWPKSNDCNHHDSKKRSGIYSEVFDKAVSHDWATLFCLT